MFEYLCIFKLIQYNAANIWVALKTYFHVSIKVVGRKEQFGYSLIGSVKVGVVNKISETFILHTIQYKPKIRTAQLFFLVDGYQFVQRGYFGIEETRSFCRMAFFPDALVIF